MTPTPRVACFHGGGSSASIFQVQCEALQRQLSTELHFEFFEAPFERDAGPGVLPFFKYEKYGPYRTWFSKTKMRNGQMVELADGRGGDGPVKGMEFGEGGVERVWRMIRGRDAELELDGREDEMGEWVGVMGFSQGTRIVGGLLLDLQRRKEMGLFRPGDIDFRFGVLCMGSGPPMMSDLSHGTLYSFFFLVLSSICFQFLWSCFVVSPKHPSFSRSASPLFETIITSCIRHQVF